MKKRLILLTDNYPFDRFESFIENEIPYLAEAFELIIVSSDSQGKKTRDIPSNIEVYRIKTFPWRLKEIHAYRLIYWIRFFLTKNGRLEYRSILQSKIKKKERLHNSLDYFMYSEHYYKYFRKTGLLKNKKETIIYSYWNTHKILAFANHKQDNCRLISRIHGYDLYNERNPYGRQPFKTLMNQALDGLVFISEIGKKYYEQNFISSNSKDIHQLYRLGVKPPSKLPKKENGHVFTLCSCSNLVPLKRVKLIAQALKQIKNLTMRWIHIGDGEEYDALKKACEDIPDNITVELMGGILNQEVLQFYSNTYIDCFITVSATEGLPVSIMEAISYGMIVIATSVGGIPEIIDKDTNILLSENPTVDEIIHAIETVYSMDQTICEVNRSNNIKRYESCFNSNINNKKFVEYLLGL